MDLVKISNGLFNIVGLCKNIISSESPTKTLKIRFDNQINNFVVIQTTISNNNNKKTTDNNNHKTTNNNNEKTTNNNIRTTKSTTPETTKIPNNEITTKSSTPELATNNNKTTKETKKLNKHYLLDFKPNTNKSFSISSLQNNETDMPVCV